MGRITLGQAAAWCGGQVEDRYANISFLGACGDHRWASPGELFVTLDEGPHLQESIRVAMERGAVAVLCSTYCAEYPCVVVPDPRRALGDIARKERKRIGMRVVGVTGSVGKTTVTEMIACILEGSFRVGKTPSNQFDDIGVPMAILSMAEDTEVAVLEMGMNHYREIAYLTSVARPDVAVITNIGGASSEQFQSREDILRAKLEILEGMREDGKVILNGDDDLLWDRRNISQLNTLCYGVSNGSCPVRAEDIRLEDGVSVFRMRTESLSFPVELNLAGEHFVRDALAAICVGMELEISPAVIQERLSSFRNGVDKTQIQTVRNVTVIRDCVNAGPESTARALRELGSAKTRRVAVLGDILDLGICTQAEHYRLGRIAAENADVLLAYGPSASRVVSGAITGGMSPDKAKAFDDENRLLSTLDCMVKPGDTLLFKGARHMGMGRIADTFEKLT